MNILFSFRSVAVNPMDWLALDKVINKPIRGIGKWARRVLAGLVNPPVVMIYPFMRFACPPKPFLGRIFWGELKNAAKAQGRLISDLLLGDLLNISLLGPKKLKPIMDQVEKDKMLPNSALNLGLRGQN